MVPREIQFLIFRIETYSFSLSVALLVTAAGVLWYAGPGQRGRVADAMLGALVGGLIGGRMAHVGLWWAYFRDHLGEVWQMDRVGGLDWHGALLGGLVGLVLVSRWRRVDHVVLLSWLAFLPPLLGLASWFGCAASRCAYGAPLNADAIPFPALTWIAPDIYGLEAVRYQVQALGMISALVLLAILLLIQWRGWWPYRRFWLSVFIWALIMFGLGFLRGDYAVVVAGMRLDQVFDVVVALFALMNLLRARRWIGAGRPVISA